MIGMSAKTTLFWLRGPMFGSDFDEDAFFKWLQSISGVRSVVGNGYGLDVEIDFSLFDDDSVKNMAVLHSRYKLDFGAIRAFLIENEEQWIFDQNTYWAKKVSTQIVNPEQNLSFLVRPPQYEVPLEETILLHWLASIDGVEHLNVVKDGVELVIDWSKFDDGSLFEMLSVYYRYNMDFSDLDVFINEQNEAWVRDPNKYWASRLSIPAEK